MMTPNIDLIQDTILVKQDKSDIEKTEAGIYLPEKLRGNYIFGLVTLVGDQVTELKAGDRVVIDKAVVRRTSILGEEFVIVKEQQVFFKLI